jgi:cytochrome c553
LSDQDIDDIAAYLQGVEPVKPSAAVTGKTPKQVASCVACHGENGLGVEAPPTPKTAVQAMAVSTLKNRIERRARSGH